MSSARFPAPLAGSGIDMRIMVPGYPAVMSALSGRELDPHLPRSLRRSGASCAGQGRRPRSLRRSMRRTSTTGRAILISDPKGPTGRTTGNASPRFRWSRATSAAAWFPPSFPPWSRPMTGRRRSRRPICASAKAPGANRRHHPQPRLPGQFSGDDLSRPRPADCAPSRIDGVEYYGGVGFLKAALQSADLITTVSPTYAEEICTPEGGMGLDGLLRARAATS